MTRRRTLFVLLVAVVVCAVVATVLVLVVGRDTSDRPRELAMDAVPPCELISTSDLARLDVTAQPNPGHYLEYGEEGAGCRFFARNLMTIHLNVITNYGIDRWADDVGSATFEDVARIRGFRVIKVTAPGDEVMSPDDWCRLYVDVADDQSLKLSMFEVDRRESDPPACEVTYQAAEAAMRTLTSR